MIKFSCKNIYSCDCTERNLLKFSCLQIIIVEYRIMQAVNFYITAS